MHKFVLAFGIYTNIVWQINLLNYTYIQSTSLSYHKDLTWASIIKVISHPFVIWVSANALEIPNLSHKSGPESSISHPH